jgi:hypothetical protein
MNDIGSYEKALADWRVAQAKVDALKEFRANGGEYRLRMSTDAGDTVEARLLDEMLRGSGYRQFLEQAIRVAQLSVDRAANELRTLALADAVREDIPEGIKPHAVSV